jgi:hypothetical protein
MEIKEKEQYLPEDQDLLQQLDAINLDTSGITLEQRKGKVSKLQIQAILRSRKQTTDNDKSNKRFTIVLGAFALIQILVAGFQFTLEAATSTNKILALCLAGVFIASIIWFVRQINKILEDKNLN